MKKSELKNGMLVEDRKGRVGFIMDGRIIANGYNETEMWANLTSYNSDLTKTESNLDCDIVKVYGIMDKKINSCALSLNRINRDLIWERKNLKKIEINIKCESFQGIIKHEINEDVNMTTLAKDISNVIQSCYTN